MKNKKILLIIFLICLFIINAILVMFNLTANFDNSIHDFIYFKNNIFNSLMLFFSFLGSTLFIVIVSVLLSIFLIFKNKKIILPFIITITTSTVLNNIIKVIIKRQRPLYITVKEPTYSFPSGHTMAATTFYGFIIVLILSSKLNKNIKFILTFLLSSLIILIIFSRIYLGAHYFFDCISGFILSIILLIIVFEYYKKSQKM